MLSRRMSFPVATIVALALVATLPTISVSALQEPNVQQSFDVGAGGTLEVDASFGSIEVTTSGGNQVDVTVVREVRDRYEDDAAQILAEHQVDISQSGNNVVVRTEVSEDARDRWRDEYRNTPLRVKLEISVPSTYNVDLETAGGNISVADLTGEVRTDTSGGNLDFGNIDGTVQAHTSGGNITLDGSTGTATVNTSGGNITIGAVGGEVNADTSGGNITIDRAGGEVRAETSGGNIQVDEVAGKIEASTSGGNVRATITEQPGGDCSLSTSGGMVVVTLASGIAVDVDASTSGGVSSDLPVDGQVTKSSIRGTINGGGPELRLRASGGSIRIREQ